MTCLECGFRSELVELDEIAARLRSLGPSFAGVLHGVGPALAARRPAPSVWSALEYACHVRDVLLVQRDRAVLAQVEDTPSFARMHRDERVALCHYDAQPADEVLGQLAMAAGLCAIVFDGLNQAAWTRRLIYNWPEATEHDLAWLGRHTLHEGHHHLMDVRRVLAAP